MQAPIHSRSWVRSSVWIILFAWSASPTEVFAGDFEPVTPERIAESIRKAIPLLEAGAKGSLAERSQCFTCHNQGLPILALSMAKTRNIAIDEPHLRQQVEFIGKFLEKNRDRFLEGKGTGGQVATAGYALWALDAGRYKPDSVTSAVAEYLIVFQKDLEHWKMTSNRPPSEHSHFTANFLAIRGLRAYASEEQRSRAEQRIESAKKWLLENKADDTEDRVFQLWGLKLAGADDSQIAPVRDGLLEIQRADGGWAQNGELESDSYATGTALVALHQASGLPTTDQRYQRGVAFLVKDQKEDGSWFVTSRSKPFQIYFESGFPHGKDQFIAITASGWATMALTLTLPASSTN